MKTYYRKEDGTTYYKKDGILYGAPTNRDGSYEEESEVEVSAYDVPLKESEIKEIVTHLG